MMIDTVRLVGSTNVDLPIVNLDPSAKYILKSVDGLGPPDIDVSIQQTLYQGGIYQNSRPQGRQIIVLIRLNPDYFSGESVESLRTKLYGMITPGYGVPSPRVDLLYQGVPIANAVAYISKFEINPFAKDPEVQITYECQNAYLQSSSLISVPISGLSKSAPIITNPGDAPTGFYMDLTLTASTSNFKISSTLDASQYIRFPGNWFSGDRFIIDTRSGLRNVSYVRGGVTSTLFGTIDSLSTWLQLFGGQNSFTMSTPNFNWNSILFTPNYWGI
jgi:hypothetical protein